MWVFPNGCYDICTINGKPNDPYLIGPAIDTFHYWAWIHNSSVATSGSDSSVIPFYIQRAGTYNLTLDTEFCEATSKPMDVNLIECSTDCNIVPSIIEVEQKFEEFCFYVIRIHIDNDNATDIAVSLTSSLGGVFTPNTVNVPVGGADFTFNFIPNGSVMTGNIFYFEALLPNGTKCRNEILTDIAPCRSESGRMSAFNNTYSLTIAPNPTTDQLIVNYDYGTSDADNKYNIAIYDLTGRLLMDNQPETKKGSWTISTAKFAAGNYIVVLKNGDTILEQKKLVKK
jgi:hypothetical protein